MSYPQHEKLAAVRDANEAIVAFIEWFTGPRDAQVEVQIGRGDWQNAGQGYDGWQPSTLVEMTDAEVASLLAKYHGIDEGALEAEKIAMLADLK